MEIIVSPDYRSIKISVLSVQYFLQSFVMYIVIYTKFKLEFISKSYKKKCVIQNFQGIKALLLGSAFYWFFFQSIKIITITLANKQSFCFVQNIKWIGRYVA